ncbi:hypothetical protein DH86_00002518, partial [Scytalidium sp. 3C]
RPSTDIEAFSRLLQSSTRVLALCGAGLSAASGLDTFRGAGGMWKRYRATDLATPEAFDEDPGRVWLFYSYRRHRALQAKPNAAHHALAELARKMEGFVCLTQNVDGLHQRTNHPSSQLKLLHGSLFDVKCWNESCNYYESNNFTDPIVPSLAVTENTATDLETPEVRIPEPELPPCPQCKSLLRPAVVWFGEALPTKTLGEIDDFMRQGPIDLIMVIGTAATVYPAAGYVAQAKAKGARVAVVNLDAGDLGAAGGRKGSGLGEEDFLFVGDAAEIVPQMVKGVVGEVKIAEA